MTLTKPKGSKPIVNAQLKEKIEAYRIYPNDTTVLYRFISGKRRCVLSSPTNASRHVVWTFLVGYRAAHVDVVNSNTERQKLSTMCAEVVEAVEAEDIDTVYVHVEYRVIREEDEVPRSSAIVEYDAPEGPHRKRKRVIRPLLQSEDDALANRRRRIDDAADIISSVSSPTSEARASRTASNDDAVYPNFVQRITNRAQLIVQSFGGGGCFLRSSHFIGRTWHIDIGVADHAADEASAKRLTCAIRGILEGREWVNIAESIDVRIRYLRA